MKEFPGCAKVLEKWNYVLGTKVHSKENFLKKYRFWYPSLSDKTVLDFREDQANSRCPNQAQEISFQKNELVKNKELFLKDKTF